MFIVQATGLRGWFVEQKLEINSISRCDQFVSIIDQNLVAFCNDA